MISRFGEFDWDESEENFFKKLSSVADARSTRDLLLDRLASVLSMDDSSKRYDSRTWIRRRLLVAAFDEQWFAKSYRSEVSPRSGRPVQFRERGLGRPGQFEDKTSFWQMIDELCVFDPMPRVPLWRRQRIRKKGGTAARTLTIPSPSMAIVLEELRRILTMASGNALLPCVYGSGGAGRSSVDNARFHADGELCFSFDIKNCFDSIGFSHILAAVRNLGHIKVGEEMRTIDWETAVLIASLATSRRRLPQGAPTSPLLANLVLARADRTLI